MDRDSVNHPAHYGGADNPHEAIKCIRAHLTDEEFRGFLKGNVLKYVMRERKKGNGTFDIEKAGVYLEWLKDSTGTDSRRISAGKMIATLLEDISTASARIKVLAVALHKTSEEKEHDHQVIKDLREVIHTLRTDLAAYKRAVSSWCSTCKHDATSHHECEVCRGKNNYEFDLARFSEEANHD